MPMSGKSLHIMIKPYFVYNYIVLSSAFRQLVYKFNNFKFGSLKVLPNWYICIHQRRGKYSTALYPHSKLLINKWFVNSFCRGPGPFWQNYMFHLHHNLRLNITFRTIDIQEIFNKCKSYNLSVSDKEDRFVYYGIHTKFSLYPSFKSIRLSLSQITKAPYEVDAHFDVISKNLLVNNALGKQSRNAFSNIFFICTTKLVYTYKIEVRKDSKIVLKLSLVQDSEFFIFDGPGFLSKMLTSQEFSELDNIFEASSFQCIVQLLYNKSNLLERDIIYTSKTVKRQVIELTHNKPAHVKLEVFIDNGQYNNMRVINLLSPPNTKINVSVFGFTYKGPANPNCLFGGLTFLESKLNDAEQSESLCNKGTYEGSVRIPFPRSIYSVNSSQLIVLYFYPEYSFVSASLNIYFTSCIIIRIDPCVLSTLHMQNQKHGEDLMRKRSTDNLIIEQINYGKLNLKLGQCVVIEFSQMKIKPREKKLAKLLEYSNITKCEFLLGYTKHFLQPQTRNFVLSAFYQYVFNATYTGVRMTGTPDYERTRSVYWWTKDGIKNNLAFCKCDVGYYYDYDVKLPRGTNTAVLWIGFNTMLFTWSTVIVNAVNSSHIPTSDEPWGKIDTKIGFNYIEIIKHVDYILLIKLSMLSMPNRYLKVAASSVSPYEVSFHLLEWSHTFKLNIHNNYALVALPGSLRHLGFKFLTDNNTNFRRSESITIQWLFSKYFSKSYTTADLSTMFTPKEREFHYVIQGKHYIYHFIERRYSVTIPSNKFSVTYLPGYDPVSFITLEYLMARRTSSFKAAQRCRRLGATLPKFFAKTEQDELISIIKSGVAGNYIQAVYTELKHRESVQVSVYIPRKVIKIKMK